MRCDMVSVQVMTLSYTGHVVDISVELPTTLGGGVSASASYPADDVLRPGSQGALEDGGDIRRRQKRWIGSIN